MRVVGPDSRRSWDGIVEVASSAALDTAPAWQCVRRRSTTANEREEIERHLNFARNLHVETRILQGEDVAVTLVEFARRNQVTQIFVARPPQSAWPAILGRNIVQRIVELARDMQVTIVAERRRMGGPDR